ncbi:peptidase S7 [Candidatus Formimonas warabiya]|uniref:Peptidase S7 n=1 Tax=Formimonas warabiya TaxID=1761012 RepID=A0A3G1KR82_FORW1|nr:peptidase S7 [Candidatus Formimonas warabiya]
MQIKGIARSIVDRLVDRTLKLGQGRNAGCIGFIDEEGYISRTTPLVNGGLSGVPLRMLLDKVVPMHNRSLLEGITFLPSNAVFIMSRPGKTGLITDVSAVDFFNLPVLSVGVKESKGLTGVGSVSPQPEYFDLATKSELVDIETLSASTMAEEREVLKQGTELSLEYLDVSEEVPLVDIPVQETPEGAMRGPGIQFARKSVRSIDKNLAEALVQKSIEAGSGREVAVIATIDEQGHVTGDGDIVVGGMGYVPSRMMASSAVDIQGKSLKDIYSSLVPFEAIFVHTHPGGTGVMHIGDANAGPGSWNRPIIAIGHDPQGKIKGATVIEVNEKLFDLADEDEQLSQAFFTADDPDEEAAIRNRKFGIAQEYTALCKSIEIQ